MTMRNRVSIDRIKAAAAAEFGVPMSAIDTHRRFKAYVLPRQVAMYLACSLTEHSFPTIAKHFADRDHTTVYHGFRKIAELRSDDRRFDQRMLKMEQELRKPVTLAQEIQLSFLIGPLFDRGPATPQPTLRMLEAA